MANRRALRRRRSWTGLALSVGFHAVVLGALGLMRGTLQPPAETLPVEVLIVDASTLRPAAPLAPAQQARLKSTLYRPVPQASEKAPLRRVSPTSPSADDLFAAPFADGRWPRPAKPVWRPACPPAPDAPETEAARCRREEDLAGAVTRSFDPDKRRDGEFANEARHNEAMKRYKELPGDAGYPGFGCAVFHRC